MTVLLLPFQFSDFFPHCPIALVRTSNNRLNKNYRNEHPCLLPDFREKVLSFSLLLLWACPIWPLLMFLYTYLLNIFVISECWILSSFSSFEMIMWFYPVFCHINWFCRCWTMLVSLVVTYWFYISCNYRRSILGLCNGSTQTTHVLYICNLKFSSICIKICGYFWGKWNKKKLVILIMHCNSII